MSQVFQRFSVDSSTDTNYILYFFPVLVEAVKRAIFGVYLLWQCVYGKMFLFVQIKRVVSLESLLAVLMQPLTATTYWLFFIFIFNPKS